MCPQDGHRPSIQVDDPRLAALSVALDNVGALAGVADYASGAADTDRPRFEVDGPPAQRQGLAAAHARHREHVP
jgi:hypothetical protein